MGTSTRMEFSLHDNSGCIESTCGSLNAAQTLARKLRKTTGKTYEIYRYDRSCYSDYCELVDTI